MHWHIIKLSIAATFLLLVSCNPNDTQNLQLEIDIIEDHRNQLLGRYIGLTSVYYQLPGTPPIDTSFHFIDTFWVTKSKSHFIHIVPQGEAGFTFDFQRKHNFCLPELYTDTRCFNFTPESDSLNMIATHEGRSTSTEIYFYGSR